MADLHTHRATARDRGLATERVRTASQIAGAGAMVAAVGLTVALVPHGAHASVVPTTPTTTSTSTSTTSSGDGSTSTAPSSGGGSGAVTHSGGSGH